MRGFTRSIKFIAAFVTAATMLAGFSTRSHAQAQTGTVHIRVTKAGFIVGVGGGSGTLTYQGRTYPLRVSGIGVGTLGIAAVQLVGTASNLRTASDIAGTYGALGAGATFVGGLQVATLQNEKGVTLNVRGAQAGFQVSLGLAGMTIALR